MSISIHIYDLEYSKKHSPKWTPIIGKQKKYPSKAQCHLVWEYFPQGYLQNKQNGSIAKTPANQDEYKTIQFNDEVFAEHKIIAIMHLPEEYDSFESIPYEQITTNQWDYLHVDHIIEGNKHDNRIENLQIISASSNLEKANAYKNGIPWELPKPVNLVHERIQRFMRTYSELQKHTEIQKLASKGTGTITTNPNANKRLNEQTRIRNEETVATRSQAVKKRIYKKALRF
jgi:hypothetical protein